MILLLTSLLLLLINMASQILILYEILIYVALWENVLVKFVFNGRQVVNLGMILLMGYIDESISFTIFIEAKFKVMVNYYILMTVYIYLLNNYAK